MARIRFEMQSEARPDVPDAKLASGKSGEQRAITSGPRAPGKENPYKALPNKTPSGFSFCEAGCQNTRSPESLDVSPWGHAALGRENTSRTGRTHYQRKGGSKARQQ